MDRADDEKTLHILELYCKGYGSADIARRVKTTRDLVKGRIERIRHADCMHDPSARHWWRNMGDPNR